MAVRSRNVLLPLAAVVLASGAGCSTASPPLVRGPIDVVVAAPARCELVGVAPDVPLSVVGLLDTIELSRSTATVAIEAGAEEVEVRASRPLELVASAARSMVPVHLRHRLRSYGLVVEPGVRAVDLEPGADGVETTLAVDGLLEVRIAVGCNTLALGRATASATGRSHADAPTHELVGAAPLALSSSPTAAPFATVLAGEGRQFRVVEVAGVRARIVRALDHGLLDGWVDASRLVPVPPGSGWEGWGSSCCGGVSSIFGRGRFTPLLYEGPAILRRGARVRGEGDVVWARATEDVRVVVAVRPDPSAPVLVYEIDGVTSHGHVGLPSGIVVTREELVFPPGTVP